MQCKYKVILSIDGNGIKGVVPLKIVSYLHSLFSDLDEDLEITNWVDLFSSCSASSIFTAAFLPRNDQHGILFTPEELLAFFLKRGEQVFSNQLGLDPAHSLHPLSFTLKYFFGDITLKEIKPHFLFPALEVEKKELTLFTNFMDLLYDVPLSTLMYACAANATYPAVKIGRNHYQDCYEHIQNPSLLAYDYAKMLYPNDKLIIVSIGCGKNKAHETDKSHLSLLKQASYNEDLLYYRFNPTLPASLNQQHIGFQLYTNRLIDETEAFLYKENQLFGELLDLMALKVAS